MQHKDYAVHIPTGKTVQILETLQFKDMVEASAVMYLTSDFVIDIDFSVRFEPVVPVVQAKFNQIIKAYTPDSDLTSGVDEMKEYLKKASPREAKQVTVDWPKGTEVTVGKGLTVWTVAGYKWDEVHLTRTGKGRNEMDVSAKKLKKLK